MERLIPQALLSLSAPTKPFVSRMAGPEEYLVWLAWYMPSTKQLWFNWCTRLLPRCPVNHQLLHYGKDYTREIKMEMQSENGEEHKLSNHMWLIACNISVSLESQVKAGREATFLRREVVTSVNWIQEKRWNYFWENMIITQTTLVKKKKINTIKLSKVNDHPSGIMKGYLWHTENPVDKEMTNKTSPPMWLMIWNVPGYSHRPCSPTHHLKQTPCADLFILHCFNYTLSIQGKYWMDWHFTPFSLPVWVFKEFLDECRVQQNP